ncbi:hypothetical protein E2562_017859 [Oryza meyeriana var. granulata]|uniref:Uncharacterized protein n=1 Tax=Oryza meyeriana var. granulata TaxID=110450 RepID=A0A6G1DY33_9ORYZ|nr:hypothetical protein E2562_017859 [Oryza meyeriana var. granulata]
MVTVGQVLGIEPAIKFRNPATDSKVALALRVLQGYCLLCRDCAAVAYRYNAVRNIYKVAKSAQFPLHWYQIAT